MKKRNYLIIFGVIAGFLWLSVSAEANSKNGVWYNKSQPGSGMFIDIQDDHLAIGWFAYEQSTGQPVWYMSDGPMASENSYAGDMWKFTNGQYIGGPYTQPNQSTIGAISITFHSDTSATVSCPMATVAVERQIREPAPLPPPVDDQKAKTEMLLGHWYLAYTILSTFTHDIDLWELILGDDGDWFVAGEDEYGNIAVGSYMPDYADWSIFVSSPYFFDYFYTFLTDGSDIISGEFYMSHHDGDLSGPYPLTGFKTEALHAIMVPLLSQETMNEMHISEATKASKTATDPKIIELRDKLLSIASQR